MTIHLINSADVIVSRGVKKKIGNIEKMDSTERSKEKDNIGTIAAR